VPFLDLFSYADYANWDARKRDITLKHVLAMQAGLEWNESNPPYTSPENQLNRFIERETDYAKAFLDLPLAADPGTQFAYNTVATVALGQAIENSVPMAIIDYGLDSLFLPLGITEIEVLTTPTGLPNGGSGFYLKTRDTLKFGQLLIDGGSWNGQRIVSEAWLDESLEPRTLIGWGNPQDWDWQLEGYGYQWWLGYYEVGGQEYEAWVAWGFGGQWIIAIPELELSIAINANGYDGSDEALNQGHALVRQYILPASTS
jgi:CubicO group peptidase (beta-lactamase class C family)